MRQYSDQEKIAFFDANWEFISRILDILQAETLGHIPVGTRLLEWLAIWMENIRMERESE